MDSSTTRVSFGGVSLPLRKAIERYVDLSKLIKILAKNSGRLQKTLQEVYPDVHIFSIHEARTKLHEDIQVMATRDIHGVAASMNLIQGTITSKHGVHVTDTGDLVVGFTNTHGVYLGMHPLRDLVINPF